MPIRIKTAETADELDDVYRLRHQVFAAEEGYFSDRDDERVLDGTDERPGTVCLVALDAGVAVGTVRLTEPGPDGLPTDRWFDFAPYLPGGARAAAGSMLCVARSHRESPPVFIGLMGMAQNWLLARGYTHAVALMNPDIAHIVEWGGGLRVGATFRHEGLGLPAVPMVIPLSEVVEKIDELASRHQAPQLLQSFQREFVAAGELVVREGDPTDDTYVVVSGTAVAAKDGEGDRRVTLGPLGPGDVFGELAPLTGRARSADVVASTAMELMVVPRDALFGQLADPAVAVEMLVVVAERLHAENDVLRGILANAGMAELAD